jgi:hypothetical protein
MWESFEAVGGTVMGISDEVPLCFESVLEVDKVCFRSAKVKDTEDDLHEASNRKSQSITFSIG